MFFVLWPSCTLYFLICTCITSIIKHFHIKILKNLFGEMAQWRKEPATKPHNTSSIPWDPERSEKECKSADREVCCERLFSGHGLAIELMNPLQLWLPAQDKANKVRWHHNRQH